MFGKIYKVSVLTVLRNPATLLSLIAVGLILGNNIQPLYHHGSYVQMLKVVYGSVQVPLMKMLPAFAAVVCSVGILQDRKNRFYDIEKVTGMKTHTYYLGKLAAFATVCYMLLVLCIGFLVANFGIVEKGFDVMVPLDMLTRVLRTGVVLSIPSMFVYISIPVSVSLLTGSSVAGVSAGFVYSLFGVVFRSLQVGGGSFFGNYLYPVTWKMTTYMYYYDSDQFESFIAEDPFRTSLGEVVLGYVLILSASIVLLTVGYIALRRKED